MPVGKTQVGYPQIMRILTDEDVLKNLEWDTVFTALADAFQQKDDYVMPPRVVVNTLGGGTFLTMPCLSREGYFGVKQVSVLPENLGRSLPRVQAWYTLMDPNGVPILSANATLLTRMRTAAVSALAAGCLADPNASMLLVIGTGSLAPWMAEAHAQRRKYTKVLIWGRDREKAEYTAVDVRLRLPGVTVLTTPNLECAIRSADVVSCATTAELPIVCGSWLDPKHHIDIVGSFTPAMREVDTDTVLASDVIVDDLQAVQAEAGDLIAAQSQGWEFDEICSDLADVFRGDFVRRGRPTLFKSVGLALEDLVLARLLMAS
jgi:ornithine cyclodeaminase/alanine dehydrogenase-like protein (mu-crystallin family)